MWKIPEAEPVSKTDREERVMQVEDRVKAVSYTHLDVYKRQIYVISGTTGVQRCIFFRSGRGRYGLLRSLPDEGRMRRRRIGRDR